ncbi:NAD-dependent epimerase/dehydratase family protein [Streptomyces sp. NPDC054796]
MRYLVTGATGFIGQRLIGHLTGGGHEVTALVRDAGRRVPAAARRVPGARTAQGDLVTGAGLTAAVEEAECVIHLAGATAAATSRGYATVNVEGTRRLCAALAVLPRPPRLVHCSSLAALGPGRLLRESARPAPVSAYGRSKLGGERAVRAVADRVPGVIVRPPIVYGPGDREFVPRLVKAVRAGRLPAVGGPGPRHYSLVHVDDLCRGLLRAAESGVPGTTYHVSDGVEHRWEDIGAAVARTLGRQPPRVRHIPRPLAVSVAGLAQLTGTSVVNRDKVAEAVHPAWTCATEHSGRSWGFSPSVTLDEGLASVLAPYADARKG